MDKIITVLGYKNFMTEMSDAPDCLSSNKKTIIMKITLHLCLPLHCLSANQIEIHFVLPDRNIAPLPLSS